jgi:hypothetical protein
MTMKLLSRSGNQKRKQKGQATVEFAASIIALLVTLFFSWELLMSVYTASVLTNAAKEGVRYGIVRGTRAGDCGAPPPDCTPPTTTAACDATSAGAAVTWWTRCYAKASLHDISAINISVSYPDGGGTNELGNRVVVSITYDYIPFINVPFAPHFVTHASGRIVN